MTRQLYHMTNIRDLLLNSFDDRELRRLCFDVPGFRPVHYELAKDTGKAVIVDLILEHADKTMQIPTLLALAKEQNPARYEHHGPYYREEPDPPQGEVVAAKERYLQRVIEEHGRIRILGQTGPKMLKDIFTDVYVLEEPTAFRHLMADRLHESLWKRDRSVPLQRKDRRPGAAILQEVDKLFILGRPAAGKTTLLKYLAVREAQHGKWGECLGKLPIFVPLRQMVDAGQTPFEFILDQFAICQFPDAEPFVDELLKAGKALVLFDGLDEVPSATELQDDLRGEMVKTLERFAKKYEACHIVITCRIAATEYTFSPTFTYLELADFDPEQAKTFVRQWFWDEEAPEKSAKLAEQMLTEWQKVEHQSIRDLTRSPLLLALLCLTYEKTSSFPARRVEIYEEALAALLKKWDASRQIRRESLYRRLSLGRKEQMFAQIAYNAFVAGSVLFRQSDLETQIKGYLARMPEMPDLLDIDAEMVLREIVAQHGIFVEQAHRLYSFAHLTFQEYYAARHIWENGSTGTLEALVEHIANDKWREVFLLTASRLQDATHFLTLFERALQEQAAHHPRLGAWLRLIDNFAGSSRAGYRRSATRLFYASAIDPDTGRSYMYPMRDPNNFCDQTLAIARALDLELDLVCDISNVEATLSRFVHALHDYGADHYRHPDFDRSLKQAMERLLFASRRLGEVEQLERLAVLEVPAGAATAEAWLAWASQLQTAVDGLDAIRRYWQLHEEAAAFPPEVPRFDHQDLHARAVYLQCTELFCRCLQLAYTPDREAFEDRVLAPPL